MTIKHSQQMIKLMANLWGQRIKEDLNEVLVFGNLGDGKTIDPDEVMATIGKDGALVTVTIEVDAGVEGAGGDDGPKQLAAFKSHIQIEPGAFKG